MAYHSSNTTLDLLPPLHLVHYRHFTCFLLDKRNIMSDQSTAKANGTSPKGKTTAKSEGTPLRDSKGWDGKARVEKQAVLANPEALTDPEYSDDENIVPGESIGADEGWSVGPGRVLS